MRPPSAALPLALGLLACASSPERPPSDPTVVWAGSAPLIFEGLVLTVQDETARVEVERVLRGDLLVGFEGRAAEVVLASPSRLRPGGLELFFARPGAGRGLRVVEIGHAPSTPELDRRVASRLLRRRRDELAARLARAELVVVADARNLVPLELERTGEPFSDPDPQWSAVRLSVRSLERGRCDGDELVLAFPATREPPYDDAPKPRIGQTAIWLLRRGRPQGFLGEAWLAIERLDLSWLEAVRSVLEEEGGAYSPSAPSEAATESPRASRS